MSTLQHFQVNPPLDFAWIELTNSCNLECKHCYSQSGPHTGYKDRLTENDYIRLLGELSLAGCRNVQFIGGEPTLNNNLVRLIMHASQTGFSNIEVYTNLIRMPDPLLRTIVDYKVKIATSFYTNDPTTHDSITGSRGSFQRTVRNIKKVIEADVEIRAGVIIMEENATHADETKAYLRTLGIKDVGFDYARGIGRAQSAAKCSLNELCGECAGGVISISSEGFVNPCNMARDWSVGSICESSLDTILKSKNLLDTRRAIWDAVVEPRSHDEDIRMMCSPKECNPYNACCPSTQSCSPCAPHGCSPCRPKG